MMTGDGSAPGITLESRNTDWPSDGGRVSTAAAACSTQAARQRQGRTDWRVIRCDCGRRRRVRDPKLGVVSSALTTPSVRFFASRTAKVAVGLIVALCVVGLSIGLGVSSP